MYNGRISNFKPLLFVKSWIDVAQISYGLSYEVCSTTSNLFTFGYFALVFRISTISTIIHQQLVAMLRGYMRFAYMLDSYVVYWTHMWDIIQNLWPTFRHFKLKVAISNHIRKQICHFHVLVSIFSVHILDNISHTLVYMHYVGSHR